MCELWKDIPEFCGSYQVSSLGRVRSLDRITTQGHFAKGIVLKGRVGKQGYPYVILKNGKFTKTVKVHRLVAEAFVPNPKGYLVVNHKDENKQNSRASNLEWCNAKYNANYGTGIARMLEKTREPVVQLDLSGNVIAVFPGLLEAQRQTGINESKISMCCSGLRKKTGGFQWKKARDIELNLTQGYHQRALERGIRRADVAWREARA